MNQICGGGIGNHASANLPGVVHKLKASFQGCFWRTMPHCSPQKPNHHLPCCYSLKDPERQHWASSIVDIAFYYQQHNMLTSLNDFTNINESETTQILPV